MRVRNQLGLQVRSQHLRSHRCAGDCVGSGGATDPGAENVDTVCLDVDY